MNRALEGIPKGLWSMVGLVFHRLLIIDYDGTLAPFHVARNAARPIPRSLTLLQELSSTGRTQVAITSGRPIEELSGFLGDLPAILIGENGWEHQLPGESRVRHPIPPDAGKTLELAEQIAIQAGWNDRLERKRSGLVIHTRSLPPIHARNLEHRTVLAWIDLVAEGNVVVERIDGGVEIRARGHDTGTATTWLLNHCTQAMLCVYLGDDLMDERAFEAICDFGFGIRVGPSDRPSRAVGRLPSSEAVADFLEVWSRVVVA